MDYRGICLINGGRNIITVLVGVDAMCGVGQLWSQLIAKNSISVLKALLQLALMTDIRMTFAGPALPLLRILQHVAFLLSETESSRNCD